MSQDMRVATAGIPVLAPIPELSYFDSRSVPLAAPLTAVEAWNMIMRQPMPLMGLAFRIRDALSAPFGVARIGGFSGRQAGFVQPGDKLDFFLVEQVDDEVLVLTARDRHLDVMTTITTHGGVLTVTSSVKTHNFFGKLYMLPVGPAHKMIVNRMLKRVEEAQAVSPADGPVDDR